MQVGAVMPERVRTEIDTLTVNGQRMLRVHLAIDGQDAVRAFLAARTDTINLDWCQRDRSLTFLAVPLDRR
jgi:hypothetical protein